PARRNAPSQTDNRRALHRGSAGYPAWPPYASRPHATHGRLVPFRCLWANRFAARAHPAARWCTMTSDRAPTLPPTPGPTWRPDSWRELPAAQQPTWPDESARDHGLKHRATWPPLVFAGEARALTSQLADVAAGRAFLLQAGDCAESLHAFSADAVRDKRNVRL